VVKRPKERTRAKPVASARRSNAAEPKSSEHADPLVGGSDPEAGEILRLQANVSGPNSPHDGGWAVVSVEALLGDMPPSGGNRAYWESFNPTPDDLSRLGYSDEPVAGLSGVKPDHPFDARRILEVFVECVRKGERLPWAIVRYVACAFDEISSAGVDADVDNLAAESLGLLFETSGAKKEARNLGRKMEIGFFVWNRSREEKQKGRKDPVQRALGEAAEKFHVSEHTARTNYQYVMTMRKRTGLSGAQRRRSKNPK